MVCQNCASREATMIVQTVVNNQVQKAALCSSCVVNLEPTVAIDALMVALTGLTARAHPARCAACRTSFADFRERGRFGCPDCYERFLPQVKDLLPRVHAGAYQHRGKTPGRR